MFVFHAEPYHLQKFFSLLTCFSLSLSRFSHPSQLMFFISQEHHEGVHTFIFSGQPPPSNLDSGGGGGAAAGHRSEPSFLFPFSLFFFKPLSTQISF
jgi:hypothetical protein